MIPTAPARDGFPSPLSWDIIDSPYFPRGIDGASIITALEVRVAITGLLVIYKYALRTSVRLRVAELQELTHHSSKLYLSSKHDSDPSLSPLTFSLASNRLATSLSFYCGGVTKPSRTDHPTGTLVGLLEQI